MHTHTHTGSAHPTSVFELTKPEVDGSSMSHWPFTVMAYRVCTQVLAVAGRAGPAPHTTVS